MKKVTFAFFFFSLLLFSFIFQASPANAAITPITTNEYTDSHPLIDQGKVVWSTADDNIFLYDIASEETTQIGNQGNVVQFKDGKIVWLGVNNGTALHTIFLYDILTGTTTQIANNNTSQEVPSIDNGKVVWMGGGHPLGEIFMYDSSSETTIQLTNNSEDDYIPVIGSGKVVWLRGGTVEAGIYIYDIANGITTKLDDNGLGAIDIDDEKIVWQGPDYSNITLYDIMSGTKTQIAENFNGDIDSPHIKDGKVVWMGFGEFSTEIYLYDIASGITTQLTNNEYTDLLPSVNGDKIVWIGSQDDIQQIFEYDILAGTTTQVTNNSSGIYIGSRPAIYDGKVVWSQYDGQDEEVLLWDGSLETNSQPFIYPLDGATIDEGDEYSEIGSFSDFDSTLWTATVDYGDGSGVEPIILDGFNFSLNHQYTSANTYTVTVSITDNHGATSNQSAVVHVTNSEPITVYFDPISDTYLTGGQANRNLGGGEFMRIQSSGNNRSLIQFDQNTLQSIVGNGTVLTAKLHLTITDNGDNWGTTGRTVDLHRLTTEWTEGNGTENDRGSGSGATWNCSIDSLIENQAKNCSNTTEWEMGQPNNPSVHPWVALPTDTQTITNNQSGIVEYDVTPDVSAFLAGSIDNYGWIIKKTNEGQNGMVSFGTKESSVAPQLIVTYQPEN